jgi:hypothetical protein
VVEQLQLQTAFQDFVLVGWHHRKVDAFRALIHLVGNGEQHLPSLPVRSLPPGPPAGQGQVFVVAALPEQIPRGIGNLKSFRDCHVHDLVVNDLCNDTTPFSFRKITLSPGLNFCIRVVFCP